MRTTPLHDLHRALGARLTGFHGWEMPLSFAGVRAEHEAVRAAAGLFDLCHMGRLRLTGADVLPLLAAVSPSDLTGMADGEARYTVLLDHAGGIVDDVIVARVAPETFDVCVNASRREAVVALLRIGSPEGRPVLERALEDEDWEVRVYAAEALKRLSSRPRDPRSPRLD